MGTGGAGTSVHPPLARPVPHRTAGTQGLGQRRRGTHSLGLGWQSPRTVYGSGGLEGRAAGSRPGDRCSCPAPAWGWTRKSGSDPGLTCCPTCSRREALGTRTLWHCVSWVSRLMEQASRPRRPSGWREGPAGLSEPFPPLLCEGQLAGSPWPTPPPACHGDSRSPEPTTPLPGCHHHHGHHAA